MDDAPGDLSSEIAEIEGLLEQSPLHASRAPSFNTTSSSGVFEDSAPVAPAELAQGLAAAFDGKDDAVSRMINEIYGDDDEAAPWRASEGAEAREGAAAPMRSTLHRASSLRTVVSVSRADAEMLRFARSNGDAGADADYSRRRTQQTRAARLCGTLTRADNITLSNSFVNDAWIRDRAVAAQQPSRGRGRHHAGPKHRRSSTKGR